MTNDLYLVVITVEKINEVIKMKRLVLPTSDSLPTSYIDVEIVIVTHLGLKEWK